MLLGRRDTVGNLEWGWSINYLKQDKDYYIDDWQNLEKVLEATSGLNTLKANTLWSKYDSRRLGAKIDGSYKAGNRHLIEFLVDASKEKWILTAGKCLTLNMLTKIPAAGGVIIMSRRSLMRRSRTRSH